MDINDVLESEDPSRYLYKYAVKHGRLESKWERLFLEFRDLTWISWYTRDVIKDRWLEAESILLESKNCYEIGWYAESVVKGRWPEGESIILESKNLYKITWHARRIIGGRWPEAEPIIQQDKWYWERYCECFNIKE